MAEKDSAKLEVNKCENPNDPLYLHDSGQPVANHVGSTSTMSNLSGITFYAHVFGNALDALEL